MRAFFCVLLASLCCISAQKPTICLNMIVKDESAVITRCLDSVKPIIDYWVIVDTGSTDGTQKIIKKHMKGIPGKLYERPWKDFAHNRNEAHELAQGTADYILIMDADDWLEFAPGFEMPELFLDAYELKFGSDNFAYYKPRIVKSALPWHWEDILHAYLACDLPYSRHTLEGVTYVVGDDGARSHDPDKYKKHVALLLEAVEKEPENSRYVFYLAESYRDAGMPAEALQWYQKRAQMGGWAEEVYCALLSVGKMLRELNVQGATVIDAFHRAHRFRPHRPEPIYYLAEIYNQQQDYALAYECIKGWVHLPKPKTPDRLFVEGWTQNWGIDFQLSICAYHLACYQESLKICDALLDRNDLTPAIYEQTRLNREFPLQKIVQ